MTSTRADHCADPHTNTIERSSVLRSFNADDDEEETASLINRDQEPQVNKNEASQPIK